MKANVTLPVVIILIVLLVAVGSMLIMTYNDIVVSEKGVDEAKAQIEATLQRRLDLIPNLVETVKGYASHEKQTLMAVTEARSQARGVLEQITAKKSLTKEDLAVLASSQASLTGVLKSLFALVENYPDLKASSNFLALQDQLEGTENRINVARQRYNSAVRQYNTKIAVFPNNITALIFGFKEKPYFESKIAAEEPVKVEF